MFFYSEGLVHSAGRLRGSLSVMRNNDSEWRTRRDEWMSRRSSPCSPFAIRQFLSRKEKPPAVACRGFVRESASQDQKLR